MINLDNIVVHDQSKLKIWVIDFTNHQKKQTYVLISIAKVIIELLGPINNIK